ncbi:MAG: hypothetical protein L0Y67_00595 [Gammaproteobacteria bacterium]|nr:hypothetical protein [Gammaproteobacteria bacterium]MCI0590103.1 hypothetical protein [Gammaproteobacteria bacterium]
MKWLCISLLVLNVAYFAWEFDQQAKLDVRQAVQFGPLPPNINRLRLLGELEILPKVRGASEPDEIEQREGKVEAVPSAEPNESDDTTAASPSMGDTPATGSPPEDKSVVSAVPEAKPEAPVELCVSIGPFTAEGDATEVDEWFQDRRSFTRRRLADDKGRKFFWIYLEPMKSRAMAEKTIEELKQRNVLDYVLINKGDLRNAISLGLFSSQASVNKRLRELESKGYNPVVVPYYNAAKAYWVDVRFVPNENLTDAMYKGFISKLNSVPVPCPEIAMVPPNP